MTDDTAGDAEPDAEEADAAAQAAPDDAADPDDEAAADTESEGFQPGDFVRIEYTARTVDGEDLVDTTDPAVVEEEGIESDQEFEPRIVVLGEDHLFETVENDIIGSKVGDSGSVVVPAVEAFGEYDDEEVRTVSADKIPEDDRYPGAQVQIDNQQGQVETIVGGRARVNFNHPLAGEDIRYEWTVVDEISDRQARAEGLLSTLLEVDLDVWFQTDTVEEEQLVEPEEDEAEPDSEDEATEGEDADEEPAEPETEVVDVEKESLYIDADPQLTMNQQWMMGKQQIAQQLIDLLDVDRVVVQEVIEGMGGMGMPGMMGMGGGGEADLEAALEEADIDAEDLAEDLED